MNRFFAILATLALIATAPLVQAQTNHLVILPAITMPAAPSGEGQTGGGPTYCTAQAPCTGINWINGSDVAATVTSTPAGVETAGPANAAVYKCTVAGTQTCNPASFSTAAGSPWIPVPVTNGQSLLQTTSTGGPFYDPAVVFGATYVYAITLTYTGALSNGQATAPGTSQLTFPAAPGQQPAAPTGVSASVVE